MATLSSIGSWLLGIIIDHGLSFLSGLISAWLSMWAAKRVKKNQAQADQTQLENAKTPEEKKNAASNIGHDTFGGH